MATSAFQLEGSPYADWTSWDSILTERPDVTDHYSLYRQDLALAQEKAMWSNFSMPMATNLNPTVTFL